VDVIGAALRTLRNLVQRCEVSQISIVVSAVLSHLETDRQWSDLERCQWLAEIITSFTMLQYRYAVPAALLETLSAEADAQEATVKQNTLLSMLTAILSARKISLVGISTTELLGSLVHLIVRRTNVDIKDPLLMSIVRAVSALSTHVYYADQANDLVEELASRIAGVQATGPSSPVTSTPSSTRELETRQSTIRVLVACLTNLMLSGSVDGPETDNAATNDKGKARDSDPPSNTASLLSGPSKRNPISPEVWQETLPLLCESTFAVRAEYARALLLYLQQELPAFASHVDGMDDERPKIVERFMHALFATLYTLAMSSTLGFAGPALLVSSEEAVEQDEDLAELSKPSFRVRPSIGDGAALESPSLSVLGVSGTATPPPPRLSGRRMSKLVSLPLNRLDERATTLPEAEIAQDVAGPKDYAIFAEIIAKLARLAGAVATRTGIPMLISLDRDAGTLVKRSQDRRGNAYISERRRACKEVVLKGWMAFARQWDAVGCEELITQVRERSA
jgi:protein EFR3